MCCGPCSIYPLKAALSGESEVWGFFHNPNIHPRAEFRKRLQAARRLAELMSVKVVFDDRYAPGEFIQGVKAASPGSRHPAEGERCTYCYSSRLEETAKTARRLGFDAFSTSLLYSRYQNHDQIKDIGYRLAEEYGVWFFYRDFRDWWYDAMEDSREMGLYRQSWCGCVYSMMERRREKAEKAARAKARGG